MTDGNEGSDGKDSRVVRVSEERIVIAEGEK